MLLQGMKHDSGKANEQDSGVFHHDEGRKRQDDFSVDVRNLVDALRSRGNPFLEARVDLVNLDWRISNAKDLSAIYDKGKDQYDQFVNDVIVTRKTPLDSQIKNNAFQLFKITQRRKAQQLKVPLLKASVSLFGQLYITTTERLGDNCDLDMFFTHEAHSFPPSLANGNDKISFDKIRHHPLHREGSRSCIAWCNGNRHPSAARLRGSRRRPTCSPVGCSRNGNFRAVHAEIILEASSGGAAKSVTA